MPVRNFGALFELELNGKIRQLRELVYDLEYLRNPEYERPTTQVIEVKQMLSFPRQKVKVVN